MTVVAWQVLVETGVLAFRFLPAPDQVARALLETVVSGDLAADLLHTAAITVLASLIAVALGGVLGLGFGLLPPLRRNAMASVDVLRTIPAVALMPVALLTFGPSPGTELMLAVWAAQWPVLVGTAAGVRNVPDRLYDVAAILRLSRAATIRKIVVPAVVPSWLAAARLATIFALHVTVTAEMVMAPAGLGGALAQAMQALNVERMWAYARGLWGRRRGGERGTAAAGRRRAAREPGRPAGERQVNPVRGLLPLAGLLLAWELAGDPRSATLPPPSEWLVALVRLHDAGELLPAVVTTVSTAYVALVCAVLVGGVLGVLIGASRRADRLLTPALDVLATVPGAALVPLTILLLGITFAANVAIVALAVMWPVLLNATSAMRSIPAVRLDMSRTLGLSTRRAVAQGRPSLVGARTSWWASGSPPRCR